MILTTATHANETVTYYYSDPLGTVLDTTDSVGTLITVRDSRPFGNAVLNGPQNGVGFTGHVEDLDSSFIYMQARYYDALTGRFLTIDPATRTTGDIFAINNYAYANDNPIMRPDPSGRCADHYDDGTCKVNVDPASGEAGKTAGKSVEAVLNKYDKSINALSNRAKYNITDKTGKTIGTLTGKEIKAVWNGTSFNITNNKDFENGGAGGATGGAWGLFGGFKGTSEINASAVEQYAAAAASAHEDPFVGISTLTFHEIAHETHLGMMQTDEHPVENEISWPREWATSSAGKEMSSTVNAPFDCHIPGGCQ